VRTLKRHLVRLTVAGATALACAGASRVEGDAAPAAAPDVAAAGRTAKVLLVLPLNVAVSMPKGLEGPSMDVSLELENHLLAHGKQLKTVSYQDARRLWSMIMERVSRSERNGAADFAATTSLLAVELRRHTEFDAVIAPSVFVRQAAIRGTQAAWDGVTRPIEVRREHRKFRRSRLRASRTARCASLHVAVFDASGRQIHEGRGGLDLLVRLRIDAGLSDYLATSNIRYFEARPEFFDDPALLREGVAKALDPFLSPEVHAPEPL
jgi:hypothetical protein